MHLRERVTKDYWNLHLHDLPWEVRTFAYRRPETAMKHATRWLERRRVPTVEERRRRNEPVRR
jgi:hypothetical protein